MTEEIIIDGVNVAGCYFYYKGECRCEQNCIDDDKGETIKELFYREPEHNKWECEPSKDCYYKQLQILKQENEKLKEKFKQFFNIDNQECWDLAFLNNENANYRSALEEIKDMCKFNFVAANPILDKINECIGE